MSFNASYRGNVTPQLQRWTGRYSPINGFVVDQDFRGFDSLLMQNLATTFANTGCEYELSISGGVATLKTKTPDATVTLDVWEIVVSQNIISTFKNPRNIAAIPPAKLALMAFAVEKGLKPKEAEAQFNADTYLTALYGASVTWPAVGALPAFDALWERVNVFKSDTSFYDTYSVRHTTNVSNRYPYNIADENKGCIYTPAQFYAEAQNAGYWLFPMPTAFVNVLESNPAPAGPAAPFVNEGRYLWGFLKGGSSRQTAANNRTSIVTEYKQFLWSTDEYGTI